MFQSNSISFKKYVDQRYYNLLLLIIFQKNGWAALYYSICLYRTYIII